jgi:sulfonate transport system substrate-binding protein
VGRTHPQEVAQILSAQTGLPQDVVALAASRYAYGVKPVTADVLTAQQQIADVFHNLKLIPKPLVVRDAAPAELVAKK